MYYEQPISEPPQDQSYQNWSQMTPQQKMAFQMMLNKPQKTDPRGAYSTSQGISDMLGSALQLYLMGRGKFGAPPAGTSDLHVGPYPVRFNPFVFAPDIKIKTHPVRFGSGSWTAVTGVMIGTFTRPMPIGDGKTIEPNGKRFAIGMATIGHWNGKTMDHEWLFWDNQDFMKQIGLAK